MKAILKQTLIKISDFYDYKKVGDIGPLGFRRSTDISRLLACLEKMTDLGILLPGKSLFLDMGCADGRVNVLLSYFLRKSIGVEIDEWTLDEYHPLALELDIILKKEALLPLPKNINLFCGDATDEDLYASIFNETDVKFEDFDLFYTYLIMYEEFAELIGRKAKKGAVFMIYGLESIMPRIDGFNLLTNEGPIEGILALYRKI
jgi:hypothetical protein